MAIQSTNNDTITVVMAVYNVAATITETIQSVLNQTYSNLVLLVIDDCSTDGTKFIVDKYTEIDSRVRYVKMPQNQGIAYVRNYGIDHAVGDWVAFLDGDDLWEPTKLEKQVKLRNNMLKSANKVFLDNGDPNPLFPGIIFTSTAYCDKKGNRYSYVLHAPLYVKYKKLLKQNVMSCSSILAHKKVVDHFPVDGNLHEDFYTWLFCMKKGFRAFGIDEPLLVYRIDESSKSGSKWDAAHMNFNVYKKLRFGFVKSIYYMVFYAIKNTLKYRKIFKSKLIEKTAPIGPTEVATEEKKEG